MPSGVSQVRVPTAAEARHSMIFNPLHPSAMGTASRAFASGSGPFAAASSAVAIDGPQTRHRATTDGRI